MSWPIPTTVDALTPETLENAFANRFPGCHARGVEVVDAHSGTTGRARLRIDWSFPAGAPEAVFVKLVPTDPISQEMVVATGMGRREARFYAHVAHDLPVRVAETYASAWTEDGRAYVMLLEDLAESGCTFPRAEDSDLAAVAYATMESLGTLHGVFAQSPRFEDDLGWVERPMRSEIGPALVRAAVEQYGSEMPAEFHAMAEIYCGHTARVSDRLDAGPPTLIHGDCHLGNLMRDGDAIGFYDWACTARAPGLRDVAYFLANSIPTELRRSDERRLVAAYLDSLASTGAKAPPVDDAFEEYRLQVLSGWVAATVTAAAGSRMQPLEIGLRSMHRSTQTLIDLDTPELFRTELRLS